MAPGDDSVSAPGPGDDLDRRAGLALQELLRRSHLLAPRDLVPAAAEEARTLGADALVTYLIDYEQTVLVPVPAPDAADRDPLPVVGTVAGRAYTATTIIEIQAVEGTRRLWLPLLDGTERLGVVEVAFTDADDPLPEPLVAAIARFAHLLAVLVVAKSAYTDDFEQLRRQRHMTVASELVWSLVPPTVHATEGLVLATLLEPCYDNGGDAYDYALDGDVLHLAVFDAMGHGLTAAGDAALALSLARHCRMRGAAPERVYDEIDSALAVRHGGTRYVTAVLAELDVRSGRFSWISAGHPPPLLLRNGHIVKTLEVEPATPMGLALETRPVVAEESLEPGDRVLLYTDGLTEARRPGGNLFTVERLGEFVVREGASGAAAPETLRRLREAIVGRGEGALHDDATAVLVEWRGGGERQMMPPTVLDS